METCVIGGNQEAVVRDRGEECEGAGAMRGDGQERVAMSGGRTRGGRRGGEFVRAGPSRFGHGDSHNRAYLTES